MTDFSVPRYCISISIFDNKTQKQMVEEGCNVETEFMVKLVLADAVKKFEEPNNQL